MKRENITQEKILEILDLCYEKAIEGLPNMPSCYDLAQEYMDKYLSPEKASTEFSKRQIAKCTTSGFITSLGGLITLPIAVPANLASVWYVQLRMIAVIAVMGGMDPSDDEVQTLAYVCLTGTSISKIFREAGVQFGNKLTMSLIKKIPGTILTKINQKVGFRFLTKFGTKGIVNLGKMIPLVGGVIGGGIDLVGTRVIAKKAHNVFIQKQIE